MSIMLETRIYFPKRLFKQLFSKPARSSWLGHTKEEFESFCPSGRLHEDDEESSYLEHTQPDEAG